MKRCISVIIFILLSLSGNGYAKLNGKEAIDSMLKEIPKSKGDTNTAQLLDELCNAFHWLPDDNEALKYGFQSLHLAEQLKWTKGIAWARMDIAWAYRGKDKMDSALLYHKLAIEAFEQIDDQLNISRIFGNIANIYDEQSNYTKALEYDFKALKIAEKIGKKGAIIADLGNIGVVYKEMGKFATAIEYYNKALVISKEIGDSTEIARLTGNIGNTYHTWGTDTNDRRALQYCKMSLAINKQTNNEKGTARTLGNIGAIYCALKEYDSSLTYSLAALKLNEQIGTDNNIGINFANLGELYYAVAFDSSIVEGNLLGGITKKAALKLAQDYFVKGKGLFVKIGNLEAAREINEYMYKIYAGLGDYKSAFDILNEFVAQKDSLDAINSQEKIAAIETERALLVKERQIEADNRKSLERKFFFSVTGMLIIILSIVGWNFYRQRRLTAQKAILADQKEVLLQEKDVLIKEIHHRVKNNLQVVVSLLDLQTGNTDDEIAKRTITESAARVKSISLIHRFLYQNEDVTGIEYAHFIKELFTQVVTVFKVPGQNIVLDGQVPETILDIDTAVPVGLILNELLINSFKYAFPSVDGKITITLSSTNDGYMIAYSDSGKGLPEGYDIKRATTMGMTIMRNLARQVGGQFSYEHTQNTFHIHFKDILGRKMIK